MEKFGQSGVVVGEVVNVEDDPTQSGLSKVRWQSGAASQPEDWGDDKLPWARSLFPTTHAQSNQVGTSTGLAKGSKVYGIPLDAHGQEFLILGSVPTSGNGQFDGDAKYDADTPQMSKVKENGGESQPRYGDKNDKLDEDNQDPVWKYAREKGGPDKQNAKYATLPADLGQNDEAITEES